MEEILLQAKPIFEFLHIPFDWVVNIILFMGTSRLFFKPAIKAIEQFVSETPTTVDDNIWAKVKENSIFKGLLFVLDWVASVKVPEKK